MKPGAEATRPTPTLATDTMFENSFKSMYPAANATALRPYGLRYRAQGQLFETQVAEEFLVNSRIQQFDREFAISLQGYYLDAPAVMSARVGEEPVCQEDVVDLPRSVELRMELGEAIKRRRSRRSYADANLRLDYLATILRSAAGITARAQVKHAGGGCSWINFRTTPSGGALYPIEVHAAIVNVEQLPRGLYRYEPLSDCLVRGGDEASIGKLLDAYSIGHESITLRRAGVVILLVARPWRAMRKYGARGLRHVFIEAGHIAQNIHLACAALGLGSVDCSSVYDDKAHEALRVDGTFESLIHTVIVGEPDDGQ